MNKIVLGMCVMALGVLLTEVSGAAPLSFAAPNGGQSHQSVLQNEKTLKQYLSKKNSTQPTQATQAKVVHSKTSQSSSTQDVALDESSKEAAEVSDMAFRAVSQSMFPFTPKQIVDLKKSAHEQALASSASPSTPPQPVATSQLVNLSPGSTPPVIRLAQGFVSSLVFLDATGAPWPIKAYDLGDPQAFNIQWDQKSNTLMIQALQLYKYGNLAVKLQGMNTPVMLTLIPGQKVVDYRIDLRMQGMGPNARPLPMDHLPASADPQLLDVLDGIPPDGSQVLTVRGGSAQIWKKGAQFFVRTRLTVISPGWIATMTSADGMHAYKMQQTPLLLVSWQGKIKQLKVEGL